MLRYAEKSLNRRPAPTLPPTRRLWIGRILSLLVLIGAGAVLLISTAYPYWRMTLHAPQYPHGLTVTAHLTRLSGDVEEIDHLNHYIGMEKLEKGGRLERSIAIPMLIGAALLLLLTPFVRTRWALLLSSPALLFPAFFLADLQAWLYYFGQHLDKKAALSSSIKPFIPQALGTGHIGQFKTVAIIEQGYCMALAASGLILLGLILHYIARRHHSPTAPGISGGGAP